MNEIFKGIRILDITKVFSGPFATRCFADYGAEVIKIEDIHHPDDSRSFPPLKNGWSGYFELLNRNKKGITLNLKDKKDHDIFLSLCKQTDCIVENLTPDTKYKLRIDYETVKKENATIIYASLSGEGQQSQKKYYDVIAQAESGLMSLTGFENTPMKIGPAVVDAFSGMTLAFALSSALFYRERTGNGQFLDVSMLGSCMNLLESNLTQYSITKQNPVRTGNCDNLIAPFGIYKAKDGSVVIAIGNDSLWKTFEEFLEERHVSYGRSLFVTNELRIRNQKRLTDVIEKALQKVTVKNVLTSLSKINIPSAQVRTMKDVFEDKMLYTNNVLSKVNHPLLGTISVPGKSIRFGVSRSSHYVLAPHLGQDNTKYGV